MAHHDPNADPISASDMFALLKKMAAATKHVPLVKDDDVDLAEPVDSVYVGTTGDIVCILTGSATEATYKAVPAGTILPICIQRLKEATTAADLVGLIGS